ncbi:MAG TPA: SGNH/GDSL hydrolase family protein [Propionibacterium sp.]|jgi:lysophospholipase L1-like esterase|nr:SGNH/GDSL hydrolase family protein [Propionibacterium sp.]
MGQRPAIGRRRLIAAIAAAPLIGLTACGTAPQPTEQQPAEPTAKTLYVVGDSLTEGNSPDFSNLQFGEWSWVDHLDPRLTVVGGWAKGGATTQDMAGGVTRSDADVLVMLAGTNDTSLTFDQTSANLESIVETVGAPRVVLSTLTPRDDNPQRNVDFSAQLADLAQRNGWTLIDPMGGVRDGDRFKPEMTSDGIHLTPAGAAELGRAFSAELLALP